MVSDMRNVRVHVETRFLCCSASALSSVMAKMVARSMLGTNVTPPMRGMGFLCSLR